LSNEGIVSSHKLKSNAEIKITILHFQAKRCSCYHL